MLLLLNREMGALEIATEPCAELKEYMEGDKSNCALHLQNMLLCWNVTIQVDNKMAIAFQTDTIGSSFTGELFQLS